MIEWLDSETVQRALNGYAAIAVTHRHLAGPVTPEFSAWAGERIAAARRALLGEAPTPLERSRPDDSGLQEDTVG